MVNFGFNSASVLGIVLALAGAGLYLMRSVRPEVSRDHDIFFAAVGLLCGFILFFQGWRLDPILQFSQLLLSGSAIFFAVESIRLRGATSEKVRGSRANSYVEDDRPVNRRVYRAELDQTDAYDDYYEEEEIPRRRLQGTAVRSPRPTTGYEEENPRPRRPRRPSSSYNQEPPNPRSRNTTRTRPSRSNYEDWQETPDHWDDESSSPRQDYSRPRNDRGVSPTTVARQKKRRPKSADDIVSSVGTEYVDYQPIEPEQSDYDDSPKGDRPSNPDNFDY